MDKYRLVLLMGSINRLNTIVQSKNIANIVDYTVYRNGYILCALTKQYCEFTWIRVKFICESTSKSEQNSFTEKRFNKTIQSQSQITSS